MSGAGSEPFPFDSDRSAGRAAALAPSGPRTGGPGYHSLPIGENVLAVRPRIGGTSLAAAGLDTPTPGAWINQGTGGGASCGRSSLLAKTKDSVAGFWLRREADEKGGPRNSPARQPPPCHSSRQKVKGCGGQGPPCKRAARALDFSPSL